MTPHLLLVEDDPTLALSLDVAMGAAGYLVTHAGTLAAARAACEGASFELIVLDLGLPDGDGATLCRELRERGSFVPILMLTARGTVEARIEGLSAGADDYLPKPFELPELMARIQAMLRRGRWQGPPPSQQIGALTIDASARTASRDGEPVHLTDLEFRALEYLASKRGEVVRREELLERVWYLSPESHTRTVDVCMSRLRRVIDTGDGRKHLVTVRGEGYRLLKGS